MNRKIVGVLCLLLAIFLVLSYFNLVSSESLWLVFVSVCFGYAICHELLKKSFLGAGIYAAILVVIYNGMYEFFDPELLFTIVGVMVLVGLGLNLLLTEGKSSK